MCQTWNVGGGTTATMAYIAYPLQHNSLFEKHGANTAWVFANYYREEGSKLIDSFARLNASHFHNNNRGFMNILRATVLIFVLMAMGPAMSCTTSVKGVKKSKDFKYEDIVVGGMAIGGVFSNFEELTPKLKNRNATNLLLSIQQEREDYPLTSMPEVRDALGVDNYEKYLDEYATDGILSKATLGKLKSGLEVRFLAVVRIENDDIEKPSWEKRATRKNKSGNIIEKEGILVTVHRTIIVTARVYDLQKGKSVWSGQVKSWGSEAKKYPFKRSSDIDALIALVNAVQGKGAKSKEEKTFAEDYPPPRPPALHKLLPNAFETFADELPED